MNFKEAFKKLQTEFPEQYVVLEYRIASNSAPTVSGYVRDIGWTDDHVSFAGVMAQLKNESVLDVEEPEVE